jgi:hypothetical protein
MEVLLKGDPMSIGPERRVAKDILTNGASLTKAKGSSMLMDINH